MPASVYFINNSATKPVTPRTPDPVAAHYEAMIAELKAQLASARLQASAWRECYEAMVDLKADAARTAEREALRNQRPSAGLPRGA
jgi:hypothetical protein